MATTKSSSSAKARIAAARAAGARSLDLSNLDLDEWPAALGDLEHLYTLDLSRNRLREIPAGIARLGALMNLDISHNRLEAIAPGLSKLADLTWLNVADNKLAELPQSIVDLAKLNELDVSENLLTRLPAELGSLRRLTTLRLSSNRLTELSETVGALHRLRTLIVDRNLLQTIPDSIGSLQALEHLDLTDNKLTELPTSISRLDLRELYLHGNPGLGIPPEILGTPKHEMLNVQARPPDVSGIIDYYRRILSSGKPLNEAKLILVGRGGVGKTSIVNRLVHGTFDATERKTDGIHITDWRFQLSGYETVRLNVWDFGGQEIMHATHQFFLSQRSLYLLILSGREGNADADAEYWLKLIESFGADSPVIVVFNKSKEQPFDLNRRGLLQKYPAIRTFVETDCGPETVGIEALRSAVQEETGRLEHLRDSFPASWFAIKNRIAKMRENFVSFERFREICAEAGEADGTSQDRLAHYLHILGIALNYKDDPRLEDTHVLNPHWVTNGIYRILNSEVVAGARGELRLEDLEAILDAAKYPRQKHPFLIDLMKKFDLCFEFPDAADHYLIPELLDKQEPADIGSLDAEDSLRFNYHYSVFPEGILPRFIVRTQSLSAGTPRWRTGVVLEFERCSALVKADVQDKRIFVSIIGPHASRRRLLAIVRADLDRIHSEIAKLDVKEMVPIPGRPSLAVAYRSLLLRESKGLKTIEVDTDNDVLIQPIEPLLNGVDLAEQRRGRAGAADARPLQLFFSYAHEDEQHRNALEQQLKLLHREGIVSFWHDRRIGAGTDWARQINQNLSSAEIVVMLLSPDFIGSDYCWEKEATLAMERHKQGLTCVIPVVLRPCEWERSPFADLECVPTDGIPVTLAPDQDAAWLQVTRAVRAAAETLRSNRVG